MASSGWLRLQISGCRIDSVMAIVLVGFCAAAYTAFLFGQCEGRDLWQTPLLPAHLFVQALLCGSAVLALLPNVWAGRLLRSRSPVRRLSARLVLHMIMVLGEVAMPHTTDNSRYAARLMTHGPFASAFWGGAVIAGGLFRCDFAVECRLAGDGDAVRRWQLQACSRWRDF